MFSNRTVLLELPIDPEVRILIRRSPNFTKKYIDRMIKYALNEQARMCEIP